MISKSEWEIVPLTIDPDSSKKLFFTDHEWETIEAAAARIIPTDHDPGAKEARVIVFIDRYLSGIDYVYAAADGSGLGQQQRHAGAQRAGCRGQEGDRQAWRSAGEQRRAGCPRAEPPGDRERFERQPA